MKLAALISGGKDSLYAMYRAGKKDEIVCILSMKSKNPSSYMFHTPNIGMVGLQAEAMNLPIIWHETEGKKEKELKDLKEAILKAKKEYKIEGIVTGALFSNYQKDRIEKICKALKLKMVSPLWHMDQEKEMRELLKDGFKIVFSSVAAEGLDKKWLGRIIKEKDVDKLVGINKKLGLNIAGEGGEFESLVLDCPMFKKKIEIVRKSIKSESKNTAQMTVKKARLAAKKKPKGKTA